MSNENKVRVICDLPNASSFIDGVAFGVIPKPEGREGETVRVSDLVTPEHAKRLCNISGFSIAGEELGDAAAGAVKAALQENFSAHKHGDEETIQGLMKANERLSTENQELRKENAKLKVESGPSETPVPDSPKTPETEDDAGNRGKRGRRRS